MILRALVLALMVPILGATIAVPSAKAADWDERWFNPKPASGDKVLPLPCGGKIVFRPVLVPLDKGPLSDRPLTLGEPQTTLGFLNFERNSFIAAPFPAGDAARQFYVGKYDVTRDQYAAMRGQPCAEPSPGGRVPMTSISWFDAVEASAQLSAWWLANARDALPSRGASLGFARLPTEDEWEYAARGGAVVSESDFLAPTFPMQDGAEKYVQAGGQRTNNRAQQVGLLRPNPLGLYDMLGNVQQMMLESFRMNRVGRLHGQAGGIVVRGGDYRMALADVDSAFRSELPPFDSKTNQPTTDPTVGFRLVISATTIGSIAESDEAKRDFDAAAAGVQAPLPNDPTQLLATLRTEVPTEDMRRGLDRLAARLTDLGRERADKERLTMQSQLEAAAALGNFVWNLDTMARFYERVADTLPAGDQQKGFRTVAAAKRDQIPPTMDGYLRLIRALALNQESAQIEAQSAIMREEFAQRRQAQLMGLLAIATRHAAARRDGMPLTREQAQQDVLAVPLRAVQ